MKKRWRWSSPERARAVYSLAAILCTAVILTVLFVSRQEKPEPSPSFEGGVSAIHGKTIVVDAGHGGVDVGCGTPQGVKEKDINLDIAHRVKRNLESKGARVVMTRESDIALQTEGPERHRKDLLKRAAIANEAAVSAFVSIHVNSIEDNTRVRGPMVYYYPSSERSRELANQVQRKLNLIYPGAKGFRPLRHSARRGDYLVLRYSQKPAIIVETGFITNPGDFELLHRDDFRDRTAENITKGLEDYFDGHDVMVLAQGKQGMQEEDVSQSRYVATSGKLAIVVRGLGKADLEEGLIAINRPISFAVLPFGKYSEKIDVQAFENGHEILIDIAASSYKDSKQKSMGKYIDEAYSRIDHAIGLHFHSDAKASLEDQQAEEILAKAKERLFSVFADGSKKAAQMEKQAKEQLIPYHKGEKVLESKMNAEEIAEEIMGAARKAILSRAALLVVDIEKINQRELISALESSIPNLEGLGVELVYSTELVDY